MAKSATTADNATAVQFSVNNSALNGSISMVREKKYHRRVSRVPVGWFD